MSKIYRLTLGFDPISNVDVEALSLSDALRKVIVWLKDNGNEVNEEIVLAAELISTTNPLEVNVASEDEIVPED